MSLPDVERPMVSVLVPVYNAERYLERCLGSILNQDYPQIEIVAVDDGSSDDSYRILTSYQERFPGKVAVHHQENAGVAAARNKAIELARGTYLMFADNDDYLEPDAVSLLVDAAQQTEAEVVCAGFQRSDENGRVISSMVPDPSTQWAPYEVSAAWAKLFSTAFVRRYDLSFLPTNIGEDIYFTLPAISLSKRTTVVQAIVYNWFYNTASVSNTLHKTSSGLELDTTMQQVIDLLNKQGLSVSGMSLHYLIRLVAWFLMYTRRGDGLRRSREVLREYIGWLDSHLPDWRDDPFATPSLPTGDALPSRLATWLFVRHPRLFSVALALYGLA